MRRFTCCLSKEEIDVIYGLVDTLENYNNNIQLVYPTLEDPPILISGSGEKWSIGNFIELIPKNKILESFSLRYFNTGIASGVCTYEVHLFSGDIGEEIIFSKLRFARLSNQSGASPFPIISPVFNGGTRISAKMAVSLTTEETLKCSLAYYCL